MAAMFGQAPPSAYGPMAKIRLHRLDIRSKVRQLNTQEPPGTTTLHNWSMASKRDDELLERLDAHIARMDEHLRRSEAAHRRSEAAHRRSEAAHRRSERAFQLSEERFELNRLAFERTFGALDALIKGIEDMREDIRANTQATLKLLDRFSNGGQAA
jgi:hypothetical protein